MSRHPFTFACDYIRSLSPVADSGVVLSRSDASRIREGIAKALGMEDRELACKLSDYYQANQTEITNTSTQRLLRELANPSED